MTPQVSRTAGGTFQGRDNPPFLHLPAAPFGLGCKPALLSALSRMRQLLLHEISYSIITTSLTTLCRDGRRQRRLIRPPSTGRSRRSTGSGPPSTCPLVLSRKD